MANKNPFPPRRETPPAKAAQAAAPAHGFSVFRETIESIVVAFVLAFLFRTFEAEAFVIPTGSMSPSLLGQHKDVHCDQCGFRFRTTASSEGEDRDRLIAELPTLTGWRAEQTRATIRSLDVLGGMCPMCRHLMPFRTDLPNDVADQVDLTDVETETSYPGDRILVNKYGFDFSEPERWDVVVFKFPGDGNMNYIKRLVGLPGESLRVFQGDVFTKLISAPKSAYRIERKPADKVAAMLEIVHDSNYESATLTNAGWPLRWAATTPDGWKVDVKAGEQTVAPQFSVDMPAEAPAAWLRYRHLPPNHDNWRLAVALSSDEAYAQLRQENPSDAPTTAAEGKAKLAADAHPQLIVDFNAYNARLLRGFAERDGWEIRPNSGQNSGSFGTEWVGDLAIDVDLNVEEARGEAMLDLVEAGYHHRATINLKSGQVRLSIVDGRTGEPLAFKATGQTAIKAPGKYSLRLANVDDQMHLWVDGELVDCGDATYDPDKIFASMGGRKGLIPWASEDVGGDQGDLAPVGVAARGAKLSVSRLAVLRDIYYIAAKYPGEGDHLRDYVYPSQGFMLDGQTYKGLQDPQALFMERGNWPRFATRHWREFDVDEGQLFVMGDNSPESKDARLWMQGDMKSGFPGGQYLDRELLIGKALCVFWPHSWGSIPGLPILPGWPNFGDVRLVR